MGKIQDFVVWFFVILTGLQAIAVGYMWQTVVGGNLSYLFAMSGGFILVLLLLTAIVEFRRRLNKKM